MARFIAILLLIGLFVVGCGTPGATTDGVATLPPGTTSPTGGDTLGTGGIDDADIIGTVSGVEAGGAGQIAVLTVEADPAANNMYPMARVGLLEETRVYRYSSDTDTLIEWGDLMVGDLVAVNFIEPFTDTEPMEAEAAEIRVLDALP